MYQICKYRALASNKCTWQPSTGRDPSFEVDERALEARYKALQKELHPDKFSTASPEERAFSDAQAAAVNAAYDTLRHPLRRARALLRLHGIEPAEGDRVEDPALLAYAMETREAVEEAETRPELERLLAESRERQAETTTALRAACAKKDWPAAAEATTRLRYIFRTQEAILDKM